MNDYFPEPSTDILKQEFREAGLTKDKQSTINQDILSKEQFLTLTLDILQNFAKQNQVKKISQFFMIYTVRNHHKKNEILNFCWNYENSFDTNAKLCQEIYFYLFLFNFTDALDAVKFTLAARKTIIASLISDTSNKFPDFESLEVPTDRIPTIAGKIFTEKFTNQPSQAIENLNVLISKEFDDKGRLNGLALLQFCLIEYLKINGTISLNKSTKSQASSKGISVSKMNKNANMSINYSQNGLPTRSPIRKVNDFLNDSQNFGKWSSNTKYSDMNSTYNTIETKQPQAANKKSQLSPRSILQQTSNLTKTKNYSTEKKFRAKTPNTNRNSSNDSRNRSLSTNKKKNLFNNGLKQGKSSHSKKVKKPKDDEIDNSDDDGNGPLKASQGDFEKVLGLFMSLSSMHDDLVDFTRELQMGFLQLVNNLRQANSPVLNDPKLKDITTKITKFTDYQKNYHEKLVILDIFKDGERFDQLLEKVKNTKY